VQAILLPGYYSIYCTLGPDWVKWLDDIFDFGKTGTAHPTVTVVSLWTFLGLSLTPLLVLAAKLSAIRRP
jgi:hypothetical protein